MDWIKVSCGFCDHRKVKMLRAMPEGDTLALLWMLLLLESGKSNRGGYLMLTDGVPFTDELISQVLGMPLVTVRVGLVKFEQWQMIDLHDGVIYISNWSKYQSEDKLEHRRQQDRQRKQAQRARERERQKLVASVEINSGTPCDASRDVTEQTIADEEGEETTDNNQVEQNAVSMLLEAKLDIPASRTFHSCVKAYGASALMRAVDVAVIAANKGQKIKNIDGYITAMCKGFLPHKGYASWSERQERDAEIAARKAEEAKKTVLKEKAEQDYVGARNAFWDLLPEAQKTEWMSIAVSTFGPSEMKIKYAIAIKAKELAYQQYLAQVR